MKNLKITILPLDIAWADKAENLFSTERMLTRIDKDTDIVVLPELFSTGFISSPEQLHRIADDANDSPTILRIKQWAKQFNFAICGSLLIREGDRFLNRGFFIEPSGEETFYDKKHLFSMSAEAKEFTAGTETIPVVRYRGWNIALAICYELRFPVWLRNKNNRYDVLIIPANWPASRAYAWKHLLIARAIENQAYVIGANRSGRDDCGEYDGLSYIIGHNGHILAEASDSENIFVTAILSQDTLVRSRTSFPVVNDADKFKLI